MHHHEIRPSEKIIISPTVDVIPYLAVIHQDNSLLVQSYSHVSSPGIAVHVSPLPSAWNRPGGNTNQCTQIHESHYILCQQVS